MATHIPARKTLLPLLALQIFSVALIATVGILSVILVFLKFVYNYGASATELMNYAPTQAFFAAAACLVLSFLIPELLLSSARRTLKQETAKQQSEDLPFIFVPSIFIRYSLLAVVTMIGFIMAFTERGLAIFFPFAIVSTVLMVIYFPTEARLKKWLYSHDEKGSRFRI